MAAEHEQINQDDLRIDCPILVTDRMVLRPPHEDDIDELAEFAGNPRVANMLSRVPHPYTRADATTFVRAGRSTGRRGGHYALALADSGAFIGCAGLDVCEDGLELGYWVGEPYWGHGYATEAAHALVDLAFRATAADRLHASCRPVNGASRRVMHKCGFRYVGQGMMDSLAVGRVLVERYRLERATWVSLRSWSGQDWDAVAY